MVNNLKLMVITRSFGIFTFKKNRQVVDDLFVVTLYNPGKRIKNL